MTQPAAPLRERNKARVRAQLVNAAHKAFKARGFEATTIDEIAASAEVSRRTFFRYFDCKEAIVFADYGERLERFRVLLDERGPRESALAAVRRASLAIGAEYVERRRELVAQWKLVQTAPTLIAYELELDRGWLAALQAAFAKDAPPFEARLLAGATLGLTRAVLAEWFEHGGKSDLIALGVQAFNLLERGAGRSRK